MKINWNTYVHAAKQLQQQRTSKRSTFNDTAIKFPVFFGSIFGKLFSNLWENVMIIPKIRILFSVNITGNYSQIKEIICRSEDNNCSWLALCSSQISDPSENSHFINRKWFLISTYSRKPWFSRFINICNDNSSLHESNAKFERNIYTWDLHFLWDSPQKLLPHRP